jgi:hypothetical protein
VHVAIVLVAGLAQVSNRTRDAAAQIEFREQRARLRLGHQD